MTDDIRRVKVVQVPVFVQDRAIYSVSQQQFELLVRNLSSDPLLGAPLKDVPDHRQYEFLGYNASGRRARPAAWHVDIESRNLGSPQVDRGEGRQMVLVGRSAGRKSSAQSGPELDRRLVQAIGEMRAYDLGIATGAVVETREVDVGEIAEIRQSARISQEEFAARLGISVATLRNWEQGRRKPTGPARKLLGLLQQHPEIVLDLDPGE